MTQHGRVIDDPIAEQIAKLEQHIVALKEKIAALDAAVLRMATYQGVAHVLKDPTV